jgi:D-glycero-alpha-D-manno-heptose-7-phosphate kinase
MIITRTPYRISFFGGGTDFPSWYNENNGKVISTSINKYSFIIVRNLPEVFKHRFRIRCYYRQEADYKNKINHPAIRELLKLHKNIKNIDILHHGDLPARTGIGSSSTFSVGLIHALHAMEKKKIDKGKLSKLAIFFEQKILKESVGSQDQYIAAHGGFQIISFEKKKISSKLISNNIIVNELEKYCQVFYLGRRKNANDIEKKKFNFIDQKKKTILKDMMFITREAEKIIHSQNKSNFLNFIKLLDNQWNLKRMIDRSVSSNKIDEMYEFAKKNGAISGKILGAGSGGFFLLLTPPKLQSSIKKKLKLPMINIKFEKTGSQIIFRSDE